MPLHWVREALGEPTEVRNTATAGADEVWLYNFPDRSTQVGMLANQVLWVRETPVGAPPAAVASEPVPAAAQASQAAPRCACGSGGAARGTGIAPGVRSAARGSASAGGSGSAARAAGVARGGR